MAENYILLETIELNSAVASITFDNIPQTGYTDLKIIASTRSVVANNADAVYGRFNGSSTGYTNKVLYGESTGQGSFSPSISYLHLGYGVGGNGTANTFSSFEIYIPNYTSSNSKTVSVDSVTETNATTYQSGIQSLETGLWSNSSAITSIVLTQESTSNFAIGSTFSLFGIASLGTTPAIAPFAKGGDVVANDGTYWYHAFLTSGTFTPFKALTCDILQVAGGGGGGGNNGGGGGAGGLNYFASQSITAENKTVTVGAGGAGSPGNSPKGYSGGNSQFASLTAAVGGGGGGSYYDIQGASGGSGGGGGSNADNGSGGTQGLGGSATSGQGYAGGNGQNASNPSHTGGGGGGAGGAGAAGSGTPNGGVGVSTYSSWGLATNTGQNSSGTVYYAGGGGGAKSNTNGGSGGLGGGGNGGGATAQVAGTRGTGGGGGAQPNQGAGSSTIGKAGGSGVVIIRYAMV